MDQAMVHRTLISFAGAQPCKDCHNHEMRNGTKFYERILPDPNAPKAGEEQNAPGTVQDPNAPGTGQEAQNAAGTVGETLAQN
jgi:hypothetical protein